jgi:hypothetical protein
MMVLLNLKGSALNSKTFSRATDLEAVKPMPSKHTIDSPKRKAQLALMGLTISETLEFTELSKYTKRQLDEFEARARDARWIELYLKHELACLERPAARKR